MANGDGGGSVPVELIPPPRMKSMQILGFTLTAGAAAAGFLGCCLLAGILATLGLAVGLVDFFQNRGTIYVPKTALDSEGRLKNFKPDQPNHH